jgi:hypothetical protein
VGRVPPGALLGLWSGGTSCFYEGHIYFERNTDTRQNIYFGRKFAWLKYFTYHLVPVPALNYKQRMLSLTDWR